MSKYTRYVIYLVVLVGLIIIFLAINGPAQLQKYGYFDSSPNFFSKIPYQIGIKKVNNYSDCFQAGGKILLPEKAESGFIYIPEDPSRREVSCVFRGKRYFQYNIDWH